MIVEEMIIRLRATAEGVKQGVSAAKGSLQELQKEQDKLKTELKLKVNSPDIQKLKVELSELQKRKQELQQAIRFPIETVDIEKLRQQLIDLDKEKRELEKSLTVHMSLPDEMAIRDKLDSIAAKKKEIQEKIDVEIKADTESAKKELNEVVHEITDIERNIQIKIEESGANALSAKLKAVDDNIKQVKTSNTDMEKSFNQASVAAGAAFGAILIGAKKGLDTFNQYTSTMNGLSSQMEHLGINLVDAMDVVQKKSADGLISPSDVAASIKNLTSYGYTLEQAADMVDRLKDSAANNRQAHYSLGEAVRVTTEGIKNENSVLSDAVGVTKNISVMYKEYADSIGKTVNELTQAEKVQASLNGFMAETEAVLGDAAKYSETLAGSQSELKASTNELANAYGEALAPAMQTAIEVTNDLTKGVINFIKENKGTVSAVTATGAVVSSYILILKTLKFAFGEAAVAGGALNAVLTGIQGHPVIAALSVGIGVLTGVATAIKSAKQEAEEYAEKMENLNDKVEQYISLSQAGITQDNADAFKAMNEELAKNYEIFERAIDSYKNKMEALKKVGSGEGFIGLVTDGSAADYIKEAGVDVEELTEIFKAFNIQIDVASASYEELVAAGKKVSSELEKQNSEINSFNAKQDILSHTVQETKKSFSDYSNELNKLASAYETLSRKEDLSVSQLTELIQLYPSVAKEIAENGIQRERLAEIIHNEMKTSREAAIQTLKDKKAALEAEKERVTSALKGLEAEAQTAAMSYAAIKKAEADLVTAHRENFRAIQENRLSNASTEAVALTIKDSWMKLFDDIDAAVKETEDQISALESIPLYNHSKATKKEKETTTELEKQLQLLEDQKATKEMSIEEEVKRLEEISRLYAKTDAEKLEMKKRLYAKEKDLADKHYADEIKDIEKLNKGRADNTDFSALIEKYKALGEKIKVMYADYPETMEKMLEEVNDIIIGLVEKKADKIAGIERDNINEIIGLYDEYIGTMEKLDGLSYGFDDKGEPLIFKFDAAKEKAAAEKVLQAIDVTLDNFISKYGDKTKTMTDEQKAQYEYLLQLKKDFTDKVTDLTIKEIADRQKLYEKENEDRLKAMEKLEAEILALQKEKIKEAISAEKERTKGLIDEVKKRYDAEIKAAEDAANAEIAVYEDKIKAIDALLKAEERQEADEDYQDKINRLKETLKFETDDSNKYELQKEIANLTAENEKRKRKESLEDEKESYREKIDLAKNNLSEQKEALQEKRDAEIAMHEEALESYTKKLEEELSALEKNNKKSIDDLKQTLATQKREYAAFLKQKKDDTATNNTEIEKLMNQSTTNILDKLKERVSEFADAGASAGAAWRNAFNEMVADIMSSTDSYSANVASAQAATMMQSPSTTNNSVQLQQIINTPTASPAKVARESKKALENALKYV